MLVKQNDGTDKKKVQKKCVGCNKRRVAKSFYTDKRTRDGLTSRCKKCTSEDTVKRLAAKKVGKGKKPKKRKLKGTELVRVNAALAQSHEATPPLLSSQLTAKASDLRELMLSQGVFHVALDAHSGDLDFAGRISLGPVQA